MQQVDSVHISPSEGREVAQAAEADHVLNSCSWPSSSESQQWGTSSRRSCCTHGSAQRSSCFKSEKRPCHACHRDNDPAVLLLLKAFGPSLALVF